MNIKFLFLILLMIFFSCDFSHFSIPHICMHMCVRVCIHMRAETEEEEDKRKRKKREKNGDCTKEIDWDFFSVRFCSSSLTHSLSSHRHIRENISHTLFMLRVVLSSALCMYYGGRHKSIMYGFFFSSFFAFYAYMQQRSMRGRTKIY